jgi:hypothetical protein
MPFACRDLLDNPISLRDRERKTIYPAKPGSARWQSLRLGSPLEPNGLSGKAEFSVAEVLPACTYRGIAHF